MITVYYEQLQAVKSLYNDIDKGRRNINTDALLDRVYLTTRHIRDCCEFLVDPIPAELEPGMDFCDACAHFYDVADGYLDWRYSHYYTRRDVDTAYYAAIGKYKPAADALTGAY